MSLRRLVVVARKEFRHITRDLRLLFLVTVAPGFLLVTLSYVFAMDVEQVNIAVRDLDHTYLSRKLITHLTADGEFTIVDRVEREKEVRSLFTHSIADLVLVIPHGFADEALTGGPVGVQCIVDGADAVSASQSLGFLEGRVNAFVADMARSRTGLTRSENVMPISVDDRAWYNKSLESLISMVPGLVPVILCMPILALSLALAREKETGSFESLIATPVRGGEYLVGKLLAYEVSGLISACLAWLVATLWFRVPFRGDFPDFLLLTAVYLFAGMGISLVVANFVHNQQTAMFLILVIFFVPSFFIAGLLLPVAEELIPRAVAYLLPSTHFITICRSVFLKGLGPRVLWKPASALLGISVASQVISLILFDKKVT